MAKFFLRRIISKFSAKPLQTHGLGEFWALYDKGAYQDAYAFLRDIMEKHPKCFDNGDLCILCADLELRVNDDVSRAQQLLERAREVGHSVMEYYHNVNGNVMLTAGKYEKAVQDFEQSVIIDPSVPNLTMFAQALSISNDARAMNVWKQVLAKDPNNCFAHICIGFEAAKAGDRAKALLMAKRADNLGPSARDLSGIGRLYLEIDEFQSAIDAYLEADRLGHEPKGPLYAAIAACYFGSGDNRIGRKYAEWAVRFNPEDDYVKEVWQTFEDLGREEP
jgi:tetratricopeptide (TPR) repeat protein